MDELDTPNVLAAGAQLANLARAKLTGDVDDRVALVEVDAGRTVLGLLRTLRFDLVAIGSGVTDMRPAELAQRLTAARPWQKWVLVADDHTTADDEVTARSLGAVAILDGPDAWRDVVDVARRIRRRNPATRVPGLVWGQRTAGVHG